MTPTVKRKESVCLIALLIVFSVTGTSQTGGNYNLSQSVIAGGSSQSTGGGLKLEGTSGQPSSGNNSSGGSFNLRGGFWSSGSNVPTAATASISGQVIINDGKRLESVEIVLLDIFTNTKRFTKTDKKGYFHFDDLEISRFYIITASSKKYVMSPESHFFDLIGNLTDINFTVIGTIE